MDRNRKNELGFGSLLYDRTNDKFSKPHFLLTRRTLLASTAGALRFRRRDSGVACRRIRSATSIVKDGVSTWKSPPLRVFASVRMTMSGRPKGQDALSGTAQRGLRANES